jgi:hypothetical protein
MAVEPQAIGIEEYNKRVTAWGSTLGVKIRTSIRMLTTKGKGDLLRSLRLKTAKWYGEVDKLAYHFERHGVFAHKGVGRGHHMEGGVVVRGQAPGKILSAANVNQRLRQVVLRSASVNREAVEWFNPVVTDNIEKLADLVAEMDADRAVNETKILIK